MGCCASPSGAAASDAAQKAAAADAVDGDKHKSAKDMKSALREHFLGDYRKGLDLVSGESKQCGLYAMRDVMVGDLVYDHKASGVKTWIRALDFAPPGSTSSQLQVLFHYVTEAAFQGLCGNLKDSVWSDLEDDHGLFGRGVYCSSLEPAALGSQAAVSRHTKAFCLDDWETNNFCIPIIAARRDCRDLRHSQLPEMVHGPGRTIQGAPMEDGVDVWVFKTSSGPATALKSLRTNSEERLRLEVIERQANFGADHPYTMQSMNSLISCLRLQGKTREAERYASGAPADVAADAESSQLRPHPVATRPGVAPAAGVGIDAGHDSAAIERAAAAVLAATSRGKGSTPAPPAASQRHPQPDPQTRSSPAAMLAPPSEAELARRFDPEGGGGHYSGVPGRPQAATQAADISGEQCMSLDDMMSETTSKGGPREDTGPADVQDFIDAPVAEIGDIDANMQWSSVTRDIHTTPF